MKYKFVKTINLTFYNMVVKNKEIFFIPFIPQSNM